MKNKKFTIHATLLHIVGAIIIFIAIVCCVVFVVLRYEGLGTRSVDVSQEEDLKFQDIEAVWDIFHNEYLEKDSLDDNILLEGALKGLVHSVEDPYSAFLGAEETTYFTDRLDSALEGVGIELTKRNDKIVIVAPLDKSPAQRAGILPEDIVVSIDGNHTSEMALEEVVASIRGKEGTEVALGIERVGREDVLYITIVRERITVPSISIMLYDTIVYIRVSRFANDTAQELESALSDIDTESIDGIVLDLRNNPGGLMERAVDVLGWFVAPGTVVVIEEDSEGQQKEYKAKGTGSLSTTPIVVLQNRGTASASEIVVGALREQRSVSSVGEQSFGKGIVQKFIFLSGGTSLKYTITRWLTPHKNIIHDQGIVPTIVIEDDSTTEQDEQLERALEVVREK